MIKKYLIGVFILINAASLFGQQPVVVPLDRNLVLQDWQQPLLKRAMQSDTVNLPFIDDFSYYAKSPYPDQSLWTDRYVFINNDFPVQPRSNGVATFDALDANGQIYKNQPSRFYADTLTSRPINLGESGISGVYLSFFYQPQGMGDNPEEGDSLILQFKSETQNWHKVWDTPGTTIHPFKQVMIALQDEEYLHKGFQFRFINMVSLEQDEFNPGKKSNADQWHIDYVRLDKNRNENDTAMYDVAVIAPLKSMIKGYQAIPWNQMEFAEKTRLESLIDITYRNNHNLPHFVERQFEVTDVYHGTVIKTDHGGDNIEAGGIITYQQPLLNPFISTSVDSALFELKGYLWTDDRDRKINDTVRFYQKFKNYFARDDGIPESGYGYRGINAQDCAIACRYETFMPDSLRAISLYFNPTDNDITSQYIFKIAVWRDDNGSPGQQVYLSEQEYSPEETGTFTTYILEKPVYVTKYYWIGWQQVTSGFLNVGFDRNYNDRGNLYYNSPGSWQQDVNNGTLMIRPTFGKRSDFPTSVIVPEASGTHMKVYPNPASQHIYIELETTFGINPSEYEIEIYGQTGQLRYRGVFTGDYLDVSRFEVGLYIVRLVHKKSGQMQTQKILINR